MKLCAVQMHWDVKDYESPQVFENKIGSLMEQVREATGWDEDVLVAFPEDVGTPLFFTNSYQAVKNANTLQDAVKCLIKKNLPKIIYYRVRYRVGWIRALAFATAKDTAKVYLDVFSRMAKSFKATIVAGSVLLPDFEWNKDITRTGYKIPDGNVYNMAFLIDKDGNLTGTQKKTHLVPDLEDQGGFDLSAGKVEDLKVFDTPFGKLGIAVCLDCFKEPVIKALADQGTDLLIQPSANCKVWDKEEQQGWMEGCKKAMEMTKSFTYALNPMMTGCLFDLCFEGQSSIMCNLPSETKMGYKDLDETTGFVNLAK
ncbi:MAG TPA: hypothetical protein DDZ89_19980, partial [Clostridiales bacterium]|nr:hypothetical protein [Clostridiales bacterium]